ncbi:hypothetical protein A3C26_01535 [Candidatus Daviesbacteria bacterium RIFCSPHIGHO2_02_FULL_39_12]|uniref:Nudix hydrolase domain-containing protein n=2 Tax=Candidatus Daviesiibacteriota TaxID=1752718 RepID=A0A1F5JCN2_9BACT|nr:MAG: hypothetical protein A3C26_01535 [Candidatus Daviesbacteria bacterium RIFCSPHIGHO2_02_FULL_39_12]OGE72859.1 MAG: hypothetical protein A3H40_01775 [Candidatus Daviesbacteria bacterium RIFCSPLOWO2_02_FULL_38_15]
MDEQIILAVDDQGKFLEYIPKSIGHTGLGRRHLAVTFLIFNSKGEVLLQRRKHQVFDNIWDFTASTHPLHKRDGTNETLKEAALRSLKNECNIDLSITDIKVVGEFNYFAQIGEYCENEHDFLLIGEYNGQVKLNPEVAYEYKWVSKQVLLNDMNQNPQKYTAWANEGLKVLKEKLE